MKTKSISIYFILTFTADRFHRTNMASVSLLLLVILGTDIFVQSVTGKLLNENNLPVKSLWDSAVVLSFSISHTISVVQYFLLFS